MLCQPHGECLFSANLCFINSEFYDFMLYEARVSGLFSHFFFSPSQFVRFKHICDDSEMRYDSKRCECDSWKCKFCLFYHLTNLRRSKGFRSLPCSVNLYICNDCSRVSRLCNRGKSSTRASTIINMDERNLDATSYTRREFKASSDAYTF